MHSTLKSQVQKMTGNNKQARFQKGLDASRTTRQRGTTIRYELSFVSQVGRDLFSSAEYAAGSSLLVIQRKLLNPNNVDWLK